MRLLLLTLAFPLVLGCGVRSHVATSGADAGPSDGADGSSGPADASSGTEGGSPDGSTGGTTEPLHRSRFVGEDFGALGRGDFVGDLDGDGYDDFVLGDRRGSATAEQSGTLYLFYGRAARFPEELPVTEAEARLHGESSYAAADHAHALGDFDGDGYDDFLVGAPHPLTGDEGIGGAYIVYGGPERIVGEHVLGDVGTRIEPPADNVLIGIRVSGGGDVDGDGLADAVISAPLQTEPTEGNVYLFLGRSARPTAPLTLADADARFSGSADGRSVHFGGAILGDLDGDGFADVGVELRPLTGEGGAVALYYGGPDLIGELGPAEADAIVEAPDIQWNTFGTGADFDWDGHADLAIPGNTITNHRISLIYGGPTRLAGIVEATSGGAWAITPEDPDHSYLGAGLGRGDFDGDGVDDLFVGDPHNPGGGAVQAGALYVFYGAWGRRHGEVAASPSEVLLRGGVRDGHTDDLGYGVSGGGDVDGDGRSEVLVGAPTNGGGDEDGGSVWLVYGAARTQPYVRCHYDDHDPTNNETCAGGGVTVTVLSGGRTACLCTVSCVAAADCPRPASGTVEPACGESSTCRLPCNAGGTCPDGMVCASATDSCMWPSD